MNLIPHALRPYAKTVVATVGATATGVVAFIPSLPDRRKRPLAGALAVATSVATYWIPNLERATDEGDCTTTADADTSATDPDDAGNGAVPDAPVIDETVADDNPADAE